MATNEESETKQSFPLNATTLLALLTVAGGLFAAVHRLASDRPSVSVGRHNEEISEQKVDTWLWEDPFSALGKENEGSQLGNLPQELATEQQGLRILAVMIPGGPSSESREARVRSRFALVSALAQSGYAPENPEHIGIDEMSWPSSLRFHDTKSSSSGHPDQPPQLGASGSEFLKASVTLSSSTGAHEDPGTLAFSGK